MLHDASLSWDVGRPVDLSSCWQKCCSGFINGASQRCTHPGHATFSNSQDVAQEVKHRIRQFIAKIAAGASTQTQSHWALGLGSDLVWFTDCTPAAPSLCSICNSAFGFRPDLSDSGFGTFWTRDDKSSNHSVL